MDSRCWWVLAALGCPWGGRSWWVTQTALPYDNNTGHRGADFFFLAVCCGLHHQQTSRMNFSFVFSRWRWPLAQLTWSAYWWRSKTDNLILCLDKNMGCFIGFWMRLQSLKGSLCKNKSGAKSSFQHHCSVEAVNKKRPLYLLAAVSEVSTQTIFCRLIIIWSLWIILFRPCPRINPDSLFCCMNMSVQ